MAHLLFRSFLHCEFAIMDRTYLCDDNRVKELPPRPDQVDQLEENQHVMEQQSHYEDMDTDSTSTRMQQQRDQLNSNRSGQVNISDGSTSRHSYKSAGHRDSWLLRIDSSAKNGRWRQS